MRGHQLRAPAAAVRQRPASQRPGQRIRCGRPALHAPQQLGLHGDFAHAQSHPIPKNLGGERLLFRVGRLGLPPRPHSDARQVAWRHDQGGSGRVDAVGAGNAVRRDGAPLCRFLAYFGGPTGSPQPRELSARRQRAARSDRKQYGRPPSSAGKAQGHAERPRHASAFSAALALSRQEHSDRRNGASGRHDPIWNGPEKLCPRSQLQGARARQLVCR